MKGRMLIPMVVISMAACTTRKTESTTVTDSLKMDSSILADKPAPALLAFNQVLGFSVRNTVSLADSVNIMLLANKDELDTKFVLDKSQPELINADFTINYMVAVVGASSLQATTITLDKVEVGETDINVYITIKRGEKLTVAAKPVGIFAVERRDGFNTMQFFINGKKFQVHMLNMN